jgi:ABC-2 type transport system ATP-binding protein
MASPAIEFHRVTKLYQSRFSKERVAALSQVSFDVGAGEVCAFLGPNGAGKTTSINLLMGFLSANSGEIRVLGYQPGDVRAKQRIGFLPENFAFYKYLTARELLRFHLNLAGGQTHDFETLISASLAKVKLYDCEHLKIGKYSRGMMQRVGLAQALLGDPQLLILDEPTSGLDPAGRGDVLELLSALKIEGKTVFLSSHILPEVEQICDYVVVINRGQLVRVGRLGELLKDGGKVEIIVDKLDSDSERIAAERGATIERRPTDVRIVFEAVWKRDMAQMLWSSGCDILSMNPVRSTLQELFLELLHGQQGAA